MFELKDFCQKQMQKADAIMKSLKEQQNKLTLDAVANCIPIKPAITQLVAGVDEDKDADDLAGQRDITPTVTGVDNAEDFNEINFMPECTDACFKGKKEIECGHRQKNVRIKYVGQFIVFPSTCWHHGYFNDEANKSFITAQLFARPSKDSTSPNYFDGNIVFKVPSGEPTPTQAQPDKIHTLLKDSLC